MLNIRILLPGYFELKKKKRNCYHDILLACTLALQKEAIAFQKILSVVHLCFSKNRTDGISSTPDKHFNGSMLSN